jgi:hypothetical protein
LTLGEKNWGTARLVFRFGIGVVELCSEGLIATLRRHEGRALADAAEVALAMGRPRSDLAPG